MASPNAVASGAKRAAILFAQLDDATAKKLLGALSPEDVSALLEGARDVVAASDEDISGALVAFIDEMRGGRAELRVAAGRLDRMAAGVLGHVRKQVPKGHDDYLAQLAAVEPATLATILSREHPQTVAMVCGHLEPHRAAEAIALLPEPDQIDILRRMANLEKVHPSLVNLAGKTLIDQLDTNARDETMPVDGIEKVAGILHSMHRTLEETILSRLGESDEELAERVRDAMFVFDDLLHIDDRGMQTLLRQINRDTLVVALKGAGQEIKAHVLQNMSTRAAEMLEDAMDVLGPVRLADLEAAQKQIVQAALVLATEGTIQIATGGDDVFV